MPRLPRPRLPRPRLPRPGLPRPYLPRPRLPQLYLPRPSLPFPRLPQPPGPVGRVPGAVGRGAGEFWLGLSAGTRRRLVLAIGVVAVIALVWVVAVPALPCQAPGGDTCPPADDAIGLVPEDALAYVHVNVDPGTEQLQEAEKVAAQVPSLTKQAVDRLVSQLPGPHGSAPDFARDVEPWFGGEAALAIVPAGGAAAQEVQLLEASDESGAQRYAASIASGQPRTTSYRGVEVQVDRRGVATAVVGGFLVIGARSGVRQVIDAQSGAKGTGALADNGAAEAARDALPDKRLADAYLSKRGIASLVADPGGPLTTFASLIDPGASQGAALALVADRDGLDLDVRSELDPRRAAAHPGFFSAFPPFRPTLDSKLPSDSLGYVGLADPGETLASLLEQARGNEPALTAALGKVVKQLGSVDLQGDLLPSLGGEAAFALEAASGGGGGSAGATQPVPSTGTPPFAPTSRTAFLLFLGTDVDGSRAAQALARLQGPLARALNPSRQALGFSKHKVGDMTAYTLRLSPAVKLTYAIVDSTLAIATRPTGVEQIAAGAGGLDGADLFDQATAGLPDEVSLLGYLNLEGLIALAERAGLAKIPAYAAFAVEIRRLQALGAAVRSSPDELATDLRLVVSG